MSRVPSRFLPPVTGSFAPNWTSGNLAWTYGVAQTLNHGLGRMPHFWLLQWECITAETVGGISYSVGDRVGADFDVASGVVYGAMIARSNASSIVVVPWQPNASLGNLTAARWRLRVNLW